MTDQQNPPPEIAGDVDSILQITNEPQETHKKRPYTKKRKKRTAKRYSSAKEAADLNIPSSDEEPRSKVFLTAVANLLLLVAVLMIVFAAHRAVQNNKQQTAEKTIEQTIDNRPKTLDQQQGAELTEPTEAIEQPEPTEPAQPVKPDKRYSDPYTNSGPLDLDRRASNVDDSPRKRGLSLFDSKNPWNSGGNLDLDSEAARQQYKKALSLAE